MSQIDAVCIGCNKLDISPVSETAIQHAIYAIQLPIGRPVLFTPSMGRVSSIGS